MTSVLPTPERDLPALQRFLAACREKARQDGHWKLASISLQVEQIDPLAVIDSIYEPAEAHFYLETPQAGEAVAAAEAVVQTEAAGPGRFAAIRDFAALCREHALAIGDGENPLHQLCTLCTFAFNEQDSPSARAFIPRWQVRLHQGLCTATANARIDAETDTIRLAERIWRAHQKFSRFSYRQPDLQPSGTATLQEDPQAYAAIVRQALSLIEAGAFRKIVLARRFFLERPHPFRPLEALHTLRNRYPGCHCFSVADGSGASFIGASPEWLLCSSGTWLETEAIAGTISRARSVSEDARLAQNLIRSGKDQHEHRLVIDSILRRLQEAGLTAEAATAPQLLRLPNVQHLRTPIRARAQPGTHFLDVAALLHPTPAVGGTPRTAALAWIEKLEGFSRGLYGGLIGLFDPQGQGALAVGIRSALMEGRRATVFAGAGIVQGSDPELEIAETASKASALIEVLR